MKSFYASWLEEKKLTSAEKKKREEVAKAIERENPGMPMDKKMAIATATAKKAVEEVEMCSDKCCGKPVTECSCGPGCEYCDCYEKNQAVSEATTSDFKPDSEKSKFKPFKYRAKVVNPEGRVSYLSAVQYESPSEAKKAGRFYIKHMNKPVMKVDRLMKEYEKEHALKPEADQETTNESYDLTEGVVDTLQSISKSKKRAKVVFKNKGNMTVDPIVASALLKIHSQLKGSNQKRMEDALEKGQTSFMKMVDFAMSTEED